ncbi:Predicted alpha-1,6-mannanase, GH76 family [Nonomuraea solani]|uniref:Predicted alpha-1,6-mannanase, GH76 family n=2 Tax=Nonomuraea solani TaxID=1144553 RepID=A0A1H6E3V2_9ACTN|nr:Predicted alpha-1,6-mannanase, GH76 family [Nonomuraea solani]
MAVACLLLSAALTQPAQAATVPADADAAMSAFVATFWDPAKKYFYTNSDRQTHAEHAHGPEGGLYTDFWWEAQLWELVMDAYQRTGSATYRRMIDEVYDGFVAYYPTFVNDYNDDIGWWALASARAYEITRDARYLTRSRSLFDQIWAEHDSTYGGGIWWRRSVHNQKNVATNAPAALTAAKLYAATGDAAYLTRAQSLFAWLKANLQESGHVYDHIEGSGTLVKWDFSYNFGTYISAAAALHTATGTASYLADARAAADWATTYLTNGGTMTHEGVNDAGGFKSLLFRGLNTLVTRHGQSRYLPFLQRNATQAWRHRRTGDDLAGPDWSAPAPAAYLQSLTAAAAVSALQLVQPDGNTGLQPENGRYEAENAIPSGIGAESTQPGFTGRGYLAGWNASGQTLTFQVNVPSAGPYELRFRYAAGAGNASRRVVVHGTQTDVAFPSTGGWGTWSTAVLNGVTLVQGHNTIRVELGTGNYLNLDRLDVSAQHQAESATLNGVGTESTHPGYTGTGYVAGWNADGQSVTFRPDVSRAGRYDLTFRYAAAAGDATRRLTPGATVRFPSTGAWGTWNTVTVPDVALQAGANTVTLAFDAAQGSTNWLNLDEMTIRYAESP